MEKTMRKFELRIHHNERIAETWMVEAESKGQATRLVIQKIWPNTPWEFIREVTLDN